MRLPKDLMLRLLEVILRAQIRFLFQFAQLVQLKIGELPQEKMRKSVITLLRPVFMVPVGLD